MAADVISLEDAAPEMAGDLLATYAPYVAEDGTSPPSNMIVRLARTFTASNYGIIRP